LKRTIQDQKPKSVSVLTFDSHTHTPTCSTVRFGFVLVRVPQCSKEYCPKSSFPNAHNQDKYERPASLFPHRRSHRPQGGLGIFQLFSRWNLVTATSLAQDSVMRISSALKLVRLWRKEVEHRHDSPAKKQPLNGLSQMT